MMRTSLPLSLAAAGLGLAIVVSLTGQEAAPGEDRRPVVMREVATLFHNVRIFDGKNSELSQPSNVLIRGNKIERISTGPIPTDRRADTMLIDGGGRVMMPGLIDAHVHTMMESIPLQKAMMSDISYVSLVASKAAGKQLRRGFTTVRDMGGASFPLKQAIDEGLFPGPRIYPSGAMISQTGGHGDFRMPTEVPRDAAAPLPYIERTGMTAIADGVDQVLLRSREQLMKGATQLKLMAGGGVASSYDPLDVSQYTPEEIRAAVAAADNWGTYVAVHAYTPKAIRMAIENGVKCIEHGQMVDEATARLMAEKGVWWSLQPFLDDEDANPYPEGSPNRAKQLQMSAGRETAYKLAKQYQVKTAFGTDALFDAKLASRQGKQLAKLGRWYSPAEVLKMATSGNAELLAMCGERNPYPGKLGVIEEGALADLLIVEGNPLENLQLLANPEENILVIMKDGILHKSFYDYE